MALPCSARVSEYLNLKLNLFPAALQGRCDFGTDRLFVACSGSVAAGLLSCLSLANTPGKR